MRATYSDFSAFSDDGFWDERHLRTYHASAYQRGGVDIERLFAEQIPLRDLVATARDEAPAPAGWQDGSVFNADIFEAYLFDTIVFTNSLMFRRSLLETTGLQEKRFGMFHDLEFTLRLLKNTKAAFVDAPTCKLRCHPDQISTIRSPGGGKVAIGIQRDLLRVFRHRVRQDGNWLAANEARVRRQMARLCRAVAVPLLAYDRGTAHESRCFPARARRYLARCRECGQNEPLLYAMSYAPHLARRLAFGAMRLGQSRRATTRDS